MPRLFPRAFVLTVLVASCGLIISCKGGAKAGAAAGYASYQPAGFDKLASFVMDAPPVDPAADKSVKPTVDVSKIPAEVKALSGQNVRATGFMIPVKLVNGLVTEFLLVRDQLTCCYGGSPNPNHWVMVKLPKGVKNISDMPVNVYGKMTIAPVFDTSNYLIAIYSMDAEMVEGAPDAPIPNSQ